MATCEGPSDFKFLYDLNLPIEEKVNIISKEIYGADGIQLSDLAQKQVDTYTRQGYGNLPSEFYYYYALVYVFAHTFTSLHGQDPILFFTRS